MRTVLLCVLGLACISPVMHFGEGKSAKQAQRDTMSEIGPARLATGETWNGEVSTRKVRVWADSQFRAQNIHWQKTFDEALELANVVTVPIFGLRLVAEYAIWDRNVSGATLTDDIAALQERDPGDNVFAVIGLTSSLPLVSATFDQLGLAAIGGRHIMLRGYADLAERKMYANAFPDLRPEERELALDHLRHHKTAVVLLHELGHILGVEHETSSTSIMNETYSNEATSFSAHSRQVMLASVDQRLGRTSTQSVVASGVVDAGAQGAANASDSPAVPVTQLPQDAKPSTQASVQHDPIVIRITRKRETIVAGKRLDAPSLTVMLKAAFANDPKTPIVVSQDRNLPTGVLGDLLDRLKEAGFVRVTFEWSGR